MKKQKFISLALAAVILFALSLPVFTITASAALPDDKLVASYSFDEIVNGYVVDGTGKNHGEAIKGVEIADDADRGKVLSFDGSTGYVLLPNGIMKDLSEITISAWYNYQSDAVWSRVYDFGSSTDQNMFLTPISGAAGTIVAANKNEPEVSGEEQALDFSDPPTNTWTHVAVTVGKGTLTLYVNGEKVDALEGTEIKPSDLGETTQNYIGKSQWPDPLFTGMMDDVAIYSTALTDAQVTELMNNKFTTPESATSTVPQPQKPFIANSVSTRDDKLISRYTFNENVDNYAIDDINANNGKFIGESKIVNDSARGNVLSLDGKSGYVHLPDGIMKDLKEITIMTWYKYTGSEDTKWQRIFDFGNDSNQYIMVSAIGGNSNTVTMANKNEPDVTGEEQALDFSDPPINEWAHVAVTIGNDTSTLYVNGVAVDAFEGAQITPADLGSTTQNYVGKSQWPDPLFEGVIDDLLIYGKALTEAEIQNIMKSDFSTLSATTSTTEPAEDAKDTESTEAPEDTGSATEETATEADEATALVAEPTVQPAPVQVISPPETGSTTIVFIIIGVVALCAGIVLISKKRLSR